MVNNTRVKKIFSLLLSKQLKLIYEEEKPDIVHVRSRMPAWVNYYAFKKLTKKPILISTFHGLYSTPLYSQVMSKVDHTIAISNTVKKYIIDTYKVDEKITEISAASIIAKVERDKLMKKMSFSFKKYGWDNNAGYGTKDHIKAIKKFGVTRFHRKTFQPIHKILSLK